MKKFYSVVLSLVILLSSLFGIVSNASAYTVSSNMQWWADDRFGMFIHFGSYSYYGNGEWVMQEKKISKETYQTTISANFNPVDFNAEEIVKYAKDAGMKYLVITAKHHEGLAMWDTKVESFKDYTGTKIYSLQSYTPFGSTGRDVLMELKNACDAAGIKFGLYYSIMDWNHSSQTIDKYYTKMSSMQARTDYINDMKAQLKELVTTYDPAIMWFDGDWTYSDKAPTLTTWWTKADGQDLYNYMKELNPDILVNERVCRGYGLGDYDCPEQKVPDKPLDRSWETCETMNYAWGYKSSKENSYKKVSSMIQEMATVVSREGNFLLNVGPTGDGIITSGTANILKGFGTWMDIYSDSIYGTSRNPFDKDPSWGTYTQKEKNLYAHVFKWPSDGKLQASTLKGKIKKIYLMNDTNKKALKYSIKNGVINITVPKTAPNENDSVIVIQYSSLS